MTTGSPTPNHDALMDQLWDYLQGELSSEQAESFEAALRNSPETIQAGVDLIEVMVMTREAFKREGEARKELFLGTSSEHKLDDVISAVTDPHVHATKTTLAELAQLEAQAETEVVDLTTRGRPAKRPTGGAKQDAISFEQVLDVSVYVLRHGLKSKAAAITGLAAALLFALLLFSPWSNESSDPIAGLPGASDRLNDPQDSTGLPITPIVVATLTGEQDSAWDRRPGVDLYAGQRLTLTAGFAKITTVSGAVAILEAPVTVEMLDNNNALRLHAGKLVGICETESSTGFLIRTPHVDVTDLGTRFGVDTSDHNMTSVHVFTGEVKVEHPAGNGFSDRLIAGQAVQADGQADRVVQIEVDDQRFEAAKPKIVSLPGTGLGLATGQADPAWVVVSEDGNPLPTPVALKVSDAAGHVRNLPNDPQQSQWLFWKPKNTSGQALPTYRIRTTIEVPDDLDPSTAKLAIQFAADNQLAGVLINGKRVQMQPEEPEREWHTLKPLSIDQHLKTGTNTIDFEIVNFPRGEGRTTGDELGLRIAWQLHASPSLFAEE